LNKLIALIGSLSPENEKADVWYILKLMYIYVSYPILTPESYPQVAIDKVLAYDSIRV